MAKFYSLAALAVLLSVFLSSCSEDREAQKPVYLSISEINLTTSDPDQGTSHSKITTVWIQANGEEVGTFELPCVLPALLNEGENDIRVYAGVTMNGIDASRVIYESYEPIDLTLDYQPSGKASADTLYQLDSLTTTYRNWFTIKIIEDFRGPGVNLQKSGRSDTSIRVITDPNQIFINPQDSSENDKSGAIYVDSKNSFAEFISGQAYQLPAGGTNVYLEMNYKNDIPFYVGVIAEFPNQPQVASPVIYLNPRSEWNKIYINLVTEISAYTSASGFKIFVQGSHSGAGGTEKIYLDNLKLVYSDL